MVSANNGINDTVGATISGVTNTLTVTNQSNTASSAAQVLITTGGTSAGNPTIDWNIHGSTDWTAGADNADSQKWKLSQGTALGTNDVIRAFKAGQVQKPLQPSFQVYTNNTIANATGDGTGLTAVWDTKLFDIGTNFNLGTGKFTAPVTGIYMFTTNMSLGNIGPAHTSCQYNLNVNANFYNGTAFNAANVAVPSNVAMTISNIFSLTAGDQVFVVLVVSGGTKTVAVQGKATFGGFVTSFSGYMLG